MSWGVLSCHHSGWMLSQPPLLKGMGDVILVGIVCYLPMSL